MNCAGDYIGRVRLGVTIGAAGSQSFVWPDGIPAGTLPTYEALRLMRGVPGSTLRLRRVRPDIGAVDLEVQRELIDAGAAEWLD